jgi:fructoselysine 6-kinase
LSLDPQTINFIMTHRLIHTSQLGGAEQYLAQFRHSQNSLVSMDYGERSATDFITRTIGFVDLAFFSLPEELAHQAQEKASQLFNMGPRLVVITLGREGSLAFDGEVFHQAAIPVEVVDTLGAGDRYIGVFLASWLQQKPIPECMRMAAQAAALTCTHYGAWLQPNFQASLIQTDESGKLL